MSWSYYNDPKFERIDSLYLQPKGEGDNMASQIVAAVNKLVYKWYNDGDVFDNVNSGLEGWANDLSSYANWLYEYCGDRCGRILDRIYNCFTGEDYEELLQALSDTMLDDEYMEQMSKRPKVGSIYSCGGPFEFTDDPYSDDEDEWDEYDEEYDDY